MENKDDFIISILTDLKESHDYSSLKNKDKIIIIGNLLLDIAKDCKKEFYKSSWDSLSLNYSELNLKLLSDKNDMALNLTMYAHLLLTYKDKL